MEGGRLLGQGTYGCVFTPPLLCKKKDTLQNKVGKLTLEKDATKEYNAYIYLHKIKEFNNYFVLPETICSPKIIDNQYDKDINKCDFLKKTKHKDMKVKQLTMRFGGIDLESIKHIHFFSLFSQLLEAGSLLILNHLVHYDIYSKNILVDSQGVSRIIDFGQSFHVNEISEESIMDRWKVLGPGYAAEPPEVTFLTAMDKYNQYTFEETVLEVMPNKKILFTIEKVLGIPFQTQVKKLVTFFQTSLAYQNKDYVKLWKLYYTGFDSWAIGCILVEQLYKLYYSYEFIESNEWKLKKGVVVDILKKMVATNPKERIDCVEALSMYDPFNEIIEKYGTEWLEKRRLQRSKV